METVTFQMLRRLAKQNHEPKQTLALLGDCATQQLAAALSGESVRRGWPLRIVDCDYDQFEGQLLDPESELCRSKPDFILLFACTEKLKAKFCAVPPSAREHFAEHTAERFQMLWEAARRNTGAKLLMFDFPEQADAVFGSFALRTPSSFAYQLRRLNLMLGESAASQYPYVYPVALSEIRSQLGDAAFFDPRTYYLAKLPMTAEALPAAASRVLDTVTALAGQMKKCVICDLDGTLWGGVIGDDGMDGIRLGDLDDGPAFCALQRWLLELRRRGILLAVCSKNNEDTAKEVFEKHPEMILRMEDIAVFVANWEDKATNIRRIQQTLNIGMDSLVFIDDNPFERHLVRELLPEVTVPELPEDPAEVPAYLQSLHLFEAVSFSAEDAARTAQYQAEASRAAAESSFTSYDEYLASLDMRAEIFPFDSFHAPRIAQLTQRSNQFNLRTVRYTEAEILSLIDNPSYLTFCMKLSDRFGEHGLISVVILEKQEDALFVNTWLMSCRVLRRGAEQCLFAEICRISAKMGYHRLIGEYLPTAKNKMVARFYPDFGMRPIGNGRYELNPSSYVPEPYHIHVCSDYS